MATKKKKTEEVSGPTKAEVRKIIDEKLRQARAILTECEHLGDVHQVQFYFSVGYRMGGSYFPKKPIDPKLKAALAKLTDEELELMGHRREEFPDYGNGYDEDGGWKNSSDGC